MLRLYTFTISHFSEKARWAFDFNGLDYEERRLLPGPHIPVIRRRARRTSVPVLEHDAIVLQGSGAILDYAEQHLGATKLVPAEGARTRVAEIEALTDKAFGLGTQRIFYASLLEDPGEVIRMWTQDGPAWGRAFYFFATPFLGRSIRKMYGIREPLIEKAKDLFRSTFDEMDRALANGPYLTGDALTRADISVASLLAPLCRPPEHLVKWPEKIPPALVEFAREFEGRPTWEFVLRMYRDHRKAPQAARS